MTPAGKPRAHLGREAGLSWHIPVQIDPLCVPAHPLTVDAGGIGAKQLQAAYPSPRSAVVIMGAISRTRRIIDLQRSERAKFELSKLLPSAAPRSGDEMDNPLRGPFQDLSVLCQPEVATLSEAVAKGEITLSPYRRTSTFEGLAEDMRHFIPKHSAGWQIATKEEETAAQRAVASYRTMQVNFADGATPPFQSQDHRGLSTDQSRWSRT